MNRTVVGLAFSAAVFGGASMPAAASGQDSVAASSGSPAPQAKVLKPNRDIITRADLEGRASANLYDVVSSLRSQWLRGSATARSNLSITDKGGSGSSARMSDPDASPRTGVSAGAAPRTLVYVDGRVFGGLTELRSMLASAVEKACYFPLTRAQGRFGLIVEAPVIEVFTRGSSYAENSC